MPHGAEKWQWSKFEAHLRNIGDEIKVAAKNALDVKPIECFQDRFLRDGAIEFELYW